MEYLTSFSWYCPVPLNGCRLSIYSISRNLAVRSSSNTWSLLSKYCQGCVGPALQSTASVNSAKRKHCPWSVAAKWSSKKMERWSFSGSVNMVRLGNHF